MTEVERGSAHTAADADRYVWDFHGDPAVPRKGPPRLGRRRFARDLHRSARTLCARSSCRACRFPAGDSTSYSARTSFAPTPTGSHLEFHRAALRELHRVARREVRVFPLLEQGGRPVPRTPVRPAANARHPAPHPAGRLRIPAGRQRNAGTQRIRLAAASLCVGLHLRALRNSGKIKHAFDFCVCPRPWEERGGRGEPRAFGPRLGFLSWADCARQSPPPPRPAEAIGGKHVKHALVRNHSDERAAAGLHRRGERLEGRRRSSRCPCRRR